MLITIKTLNRSIHVKTVASWLSLELIRDGLTVHVETSSRYQSVKPSLEVPHSSQVAEH